MKKQKKVVVVPGADSMQLNLESLDIKFKSCPVRFKFNFEDICNQNAAQFIFQNSILKQCETMINNVKHKFELPISDS